jgi:uncharacterized circularly permuted ATP-grasp superfamily protein
MRFEKYQHDSFYDEMFKPDGSPRSGTALLHQRLLSLSDGDLLRYQQSAERALLNLGITFQVYSDTSGSEKIFPFDIIPRIVEASEWKIIDAGLRQRIYALNLFLQDIYSEAKIVKDGVIPSDIIKSAKTYRENCEGLKPPHGIWCHVTGTDLVRDRDGQMYVLEDNLRCPSACPMCWKTGG